VSQPSLPFCFRNERGNQLSILHDHGKYDAEVCDKLEPSLLRNIWTHLFCSRYHSELSALAG
jgi:hypothetical protein